MASIGNGNANFTKAQKIEILQQKNLDAGTIEKAAVSKGDTSLFANTSKASFGALTGGNSLQSSLTQKTGNASSATPTPSQNGASSVFGGNNNVGTPKSNSSIFGGQSVGSTNSNSSIFGGMPQTKGTGSSSSIFGSAMNMASNTSQTLNSLSNNTLDQ